MAAVKGGDGQQVHDSKDDRDKCRDVPETHPIPGRGKYAADGSEAADALCSRGGENQFELLDVACRLGPGHHDASRNGLEEIVMAQGGTIDRLHVFQHDAQLAIAIDGHIGSGHYLTVTQILQCDSFTFILE